MKRLIGYVRVSTDEQQISPGMQEDKIKAYCKLQDYTLEGIATDLGVSGKDIKGRPGFQKALADVLKGDADGIVCWKLDRCFRNTSETLDVIEKLNKKDKVFISICESIDTKSAMGMFFLTILAAMAQMERKLIGERTSAALQTKISNGERVGSVRYGYRVGDDGKTLIYDEAEQEVIRVARELRALGQSLRDVAYGLQACGFKNRNGHKFCPSNVLAMVKEGD